MTMLLKDTRIATRLGPAMARASSLCQTTSSTPTSPNPTPAHWAQPQAFLHPHRCKHRRDQRLASEDQGCGAGRHAEVLGVMAAAQVPGMHQEAGHDDVQERARLARKLERLYQRKGAQAHDSQAEPDHQEHQRGGVLQSDLGRDEAKAPDHHEGPRQSGIRQAFLPGMGKDRVHRLRYSSA